MIELKAMTWQHDRGLLPLEAASKIFFEKTGAKINWVSRSLSDFELFPLEVLTDKYDLIMIDHPHIGIANEKGLLLQLEKHLPVKFLKQQEAASVGRSFESYNMDGHQYALALDAAAQVSVCRNDIMNGFVPKSWDDVFDLVHKLPKESKIAIPFVPVHAYSSFFSLCSHISGNTFWSNGKDLKIETGVQALHLFEILLSISDKNSFDMNPIDLLEEMSQSDKIAYSPLIYGYINYSEKQYRKNIVNFYDMPSLNGKPSGSMIGGVGLSISAASKYRKTALQFAEMVADSQFQKDVLFKNSGQPGDLGVWTDKNVNAECADFFENTLETLQLGSVRPRFPGYIDFQAEAGKRIREFIYNKQSDADKFIGELNNLIRQCRIDQGLK